ncbi:alpha-tocopherol transfer protein-like [Adelges cooleyi]|uniref:alpha-tocopherol transfer protein-like n=1 Tax=Adelges cooleyi TaxID=133065 RepID=UPI0021805003|nr:alpha-tocopherol transfer protein-like [Adelges cooleyi]
METKALILPTPSEIDQIYSDLGTSESKIEIDVKTIKEWMRKQPHLPNPDDDERRIKLYLIMCKNSLERAKEALDRYYTIKTSAPEFYAARDPTSPELTQSRDLSMFIPLPKLTPEGYRISVNIFRTDDTEHLSFSDQVKMSFMSFDLRLSKLDIYTKEIFVFDVNNMTMNHIAGVLPHLKHYFYCAFAAYPMRIHQVHIINMKTYATSLITFAKSLLKKKITERIFIHKSSEDLKEYIDPSVLPLNYGGTYPKTVEEICDGWTEELIKHREWFIDHSSIVVDENKRAKKSSIKTLDNTLDGSFRKLEVD